MTDIQRLMLEAVITIEVHARDVLYKLVQGNIVNVNDFDWISQLRYYWLDDRDLKIRAVNAEFPYGYIDRFVLLKQELDSNVIVPESQLRIPW